MRRIEQDVNLTHRIDVIVNAPFIFNEGHEKAFVQHLSALYAGESAFRERMAIEARAFVMRKLLDELNRLMPDANVTIDAPRHMPMPVAQSTSIKGT